MGDYTPLEVAEVSTVEPESSENEPSIDQVRKMDSHKITYTAQHIEALTRGR